jgi:nitroimidazol reductase NimA-like FMN-containing flavoprotein (pyridoxamine 5'-phosphate oxidase superfamily)
MLIREMTESECIDLLARTGFGRLACAHENQPYIVPFYFAYRAGYIYSFATMGQKIEWMRVNALVCVETDAVESSQEWTSVIAFGSYEELPDDAENSKQRQVAQDVLQRRAMWWQPAYVVTDASDREHSRLPVFYRIRIDRITGHRATRSS